MELHLYDPIGGGSFIPTPSKYASKRAVVNVQNRDDLCLLYATLAKQLWSPDDVHRCRPSKYKAHLSTLKTEGLTFPLPVYQMKKFEELNDLTANIYMVEEDGKMIRPLYLSKRPQDDPYNFLMIVSKDDSTKWHYAWISSLDKLLHKPGAHAKTFCSYCLRGFVVRKNGRRNLAEHKKHCDGLKHGVKVCYPPRKKQTVKFSRYSAMQKSPLVLYCDFESSNTEVNRQKGDSTIDSEQHVTGFCITPVTIPELPDMDPITYTGPDALEKYYEEVKKLSFYMQELFKEKGKQPMEDIKGTPLGAQHYKRKHCWICQQEITCKLSLKQFNEYRKWRKEEERSKEIDEDHGEEEEEEDGALDDKEDELFMLGPRIHDHDHWSGRYRGPAHSVCNMQLRPTKRIPVFFHNLAGYDGHFIVQHIHKADFKKVDLIAKTAERYINMHATVDGSEWSLDFKDSLSFLLSPLDKLTKNLRAKAEMESKKQHAANTINAYFKNTVEYFKSTFPHLDRSALSLLLRKGVFPYNHIKGLETLNETRLPTRDQFFNTLTNEHISWDDYRHAQKVWKVFGCKTLKDYHDLYLTLDTALLADVMERFRNDSFEVYGLCPTHFITAPGLSWNACLKMTGVKLQLLTDPDMNIFFTEAFHGGVSLAKNPYLRANNELIQASFSTALRKTWMMLVDCNNQYGYSMMQYLPTGGFQWEENVERFTEEFISSLANDSCRGYMFEVDLEYPPSLHDAHDQYPLGE